MRPDPEGFLRPFIDLNKCIGCRRCVAFCPANGKRFLIGALPLRAFMGYVDDSSFRMSCSSGGIFSKLAEAFAANGGVVCGVAFINGEVKHIFVYRNDMLSLLRTSKYVQSNMEDTFQKSAAILSEGKSLLFSGTPCQIAGLRSFLRSLRIDDSNLFCADLMCHGIPSPLVFQKYLEDNALANADEINFRDKSTGWATYSFKIYEKGRILYCANVAKDPYLRAFLTNATLRESCFYCPYASMHRLGDLTLGDMWNVSKVFPDIDSSKGISLVFANTFKGLKLFENLEGVSSREVPLSVAARSNRSLYAPGFRPIRRQRFFEKFISGKFNINSLLLKYSPRGKKFLKLLRPYELIKSMFLERRLFDDVADASRRVAILNLSYDCHNFGAVLVAYSLQSVLIKLGYSPHIINYYPDFRFSPAYFRGLIAGFKIIKFKYMFLNTTRMYVSLRGLKSLNRRFQSFIFGSDQIWRYAIARSNYPAYFGAFANSDARLLSYAASFGKDDWDEAPEEATNNIKKLLRRFQAISVREESGVRICSETFDREAVEVLDPTLLLDRFDYTGVSSLSRADVSGKYIACSFLGADSEESELSPKFAIDRASEYFGAPSRDIIKRTVRILGKGRAVYNGVPEWLSHIENAQFVLTNSFHCVVFAIIYRRNFACLNTANRGNERIISLLSKLGIENRFVETRDDFEKALASQIDYAKVHEKLNSLKEKSFKFLSSALSKNEISK